MTYHRLNIASLLTTAFTRVGSPNPNNSNNSNNNNNTKADVYGAVIMAQPLREFTRFNAEQRQVAADLWTKPIGLSQRSAYTGRYYSIYMHRRHVLLISSKARTLILPSHGG